MERYARADAALEEAVGVQPPKPSESRVTRVGYTLTDEDLERIRALEDRALTFKQHRTKSELVRAALAQLETADDAAFISAINAVELIRTRKRTKSRV